MKDSETLAHRKCTVCAGAGKVFLPERTAFGFCPVCKGRGMLAYETECACGRPVLVNSADGFSYCGRKECLTNLRADAKEEQVAEQYSSYGYSRYGWNSD